MAGRLDGYVARGVWSSWAAALGALLSLSILMDQVMNVIGYVGAGRERGLSGLAILRLLLEYYASMVPVLFVTVSPFVSVIAGMFAVSRLIATNEIVPMLFTGRSITRILRPVLVMGVMSGVMTSIAWQFVVPTTTETLRASRQLLRGSEVDTTIERIILKFHGSDERQTLFCGSYDFSRLRMERVRVVRRFAEQEGVIVVSARAATWNPEREEWELEGGERREGDRAVHQDKLRLPDLTPELLEQTAIEGRETMELSYTDLLLLQKLKPASRVYRLAFHTHITHALASVVLLLLSLPFAIDFERRSRAERVVMAVGVCAVYLVTDLICQRLGQSYLHPVLAAWTPTIVFGSLGIAAFSGIRT